MKLLTTAEAAIVLKITPVRVRQLIQNGQLQVKKLGRDYLIEQSVLEQFILIGRRKGGRPAKKPR